MRKWLLFRGFRLNDIATLCTLLIESFTDTGCELSSDLHLPLKGSPFSKLQVFILLSRQLLNTLLSLPIFYPRQLKVRSLKPQVEVYPQKEACHAKPLFQCSGVLLHSRTHFNEELSSRNSQSWALAHAFEELPTLLGVLCSACSLCRLIPTTNL